MPGEFSPADVEAIAALAYLELDAKELELYARQLGDILAYADEVLRVDTANVPPTAHGAARQESDRPDVVRPSLDPADAVANAPDAVRDDHLGFFFKVPRVLG